MRQSVPQVVSEILVVIGASTVAFNRAEVPGITFA